LSAKEEVFFLRRRLLQFNLPPDLILKLVKVHILQATQV
jgi:hypothetical protein